MHAITMKDGSLAIMQTIGDVTPEECIAKWHPDQQAQVVSVIEIEPSIIPQDRTFRNAWRHDGETIVHDMAKAREIWKDRMREERAPKLATLDIAYSRADEANDGAAKATISTEKQALRDVTRHQDIEAAQTPEDLKKVWPL